MIRPVSPYTTGKTGRSAPFEPPGFSVTVEHYSGDTLGTSVIISPDTEFGDMALIEGTRGCPSRCSFCLLGNLYRFRSEDIRAAIGDAKDVGIIGGGISFHPHIVEIVENFRKQDIGVHLPSLRLDEVPIELIELIKDDVTDAYIRHRGGHGAAYGHFSARRSPTMR